MKDAVLAIEPTALEKPGLLKVGRRLRALQQQGKIGDISILSIVHPGAFMLPWSAYLSMKNELKEELARDIRSGIKGLFSAKDVRAQISSSDQSEDIAGAIASYSEKVNAELLILIGESRTKLSKFLFGSVRDELRKLSSRPMLVLSSL